MFCPSSSPQAGLWQAVSSRACLSRLVLDGCPCPWFLASQRLGDHRAGAGAGAAAAQAAQTFLSMHAHGSSSAQHPGSAGPSDLEGPGSSNSISASPIPTLEAGSASASPWSPMGSLAASLKGLVLRGCTLPPHPPTSPAAAPRPPDAPGALPPPPLALALGVGGGLLDLNLLAAAQGGEEEEASELQSWRLHARGFFAVLASLTLLESLDLGQSSLEMMHEGIADCRWGEGRRCLCC